MPPIECQLIERDRVIKKILVTDCDDVFFHFDMFGGIKYINATEQHLALLESSDNTNQQVYELFCSYIKFGQLEQEKKVVTMVMSKQ